MFTASGYESKVAKTNLAEWLEYVQIIAKCCDIDSKTSVFEIGCGAGSFLYGIQNIAERVGGADYCEVLVEKAKTIILSDDVFTSEASEIPTTPKYDVVVAVGCCTYFPSKEYMDRVLEIMFEKSNRMIGIVDVSDEDQKELAEKTRREIAGKDYDKLYDGLGHLYLSQNYFTSYAEKKGLKCNIVPHPLPCYPYRYNVFLSK